MSSPLPDVFTVTDPSDIADLERWLGQYGWRVNGSPAKAWPDVVYIEPDLGPEPVLIDGFYLQAGQSIAWDGRDVVRRTASLPPSVRPLVEWVSELWDADRALPALTDADLDRLLDSGNGDDAHR
ncbi:hypothetical protein ACIQOV_28155 [Kitasatospora sp. NPDC091257]|uniref:hypothetical protein n=1 Tax=Kitasatospora sp. NPDC091257 TaxID=3364084 RepID=UPI003809714D